MFVFFPEYGSGMIAALLPIMFTFILGPCQCYNLFMFFTHGVPMTAICLLSILYFPNIKLIFNGENLTFKKIYIYSPEVQ